jgi:hypothetical protein
VAVIGVGGCGLTRKLSESVGETAPAALEGNTKNISTYYFKHSESEVEFPPAEEVTSPTADEEETRTRVTVGREEGSWTELVEGAALLACPPQGRRGRRSSRRVSKWVLRTQGGSRTLAPTLSNCQEQLHKGRKCTRILLTSFLLKIMHRLRLRDDLSVFCALSFLRSIPSATKQTRQEGSKFRTFVMFGSRLLS